MTKMLEEYADMLDNFDDEIDMCNQLGLNLEEIYDYEDEENDEDEAIGTSWGNEEDYREWLNEIGEEDSEEIAGWFFCEESERAQYLEDHPDLFDHDLYK